MEYTAPTCRLAATIPFFWATIQSAGAPALCVDFALARPPTRAHQVVQMCWPSPRPRQLTVSRNWLAGICNDTRTASTGDVLLPVTADLRLPNQYCADLPQEWRLPPGSRLEPPAQASPRRRSKPAD